jgi:ABC-type phosphate transport system substrate-binding protein
MKRALLIFTTLVAVATLAGCALFYPNIGSTETPSDPQNPTPTASETTETPTASESPAPVVKELAKPRIVFYDIVGTNIQVVGEVMNFAENGGECIVTFYSKDTAVVMERVPAEANVSTTQCFPLTVGLSRLPKGAIDVVISYESDRYEGQSEITEVMIP